MNRVLGLDIDSTIWNFSEPFYEVVNRLTGGNHKYEEQTTWEFQDNIPGWAISKAFQEVIGTPENISARTFYPGCVKALQYMHTAYGLHYVYVTHNTQREVVETALSEWMHAHTDMDFPVHVLHPYEDDSKIDVLKSYGAFGLIDDKPQTIIDSVNAGLWTATKIHPYNVQTISAHPEVCGFRHWSEVPRLVYRALYEEGR